MSDQNRDNKNITQNKSHESSFDLFADYIDQSRVLTDIERIGAKIGRSTLAKSVLEDRIKKEGQTLNRLLSIGEQFKEISESDFYIQQKTALQENIKKLRQKIRAQESASVERAEIEASNLLYKEFNEGHIRSQAYNASQRESVQNRALSMANMPYEQIEKQREQIMSQIRVLEREAQKEIKGMFSPSGEVNPEKSAALDVVLSSSQNKIETLGALEALKRMKKIEGQDPSSRFDSLIKSVNYAREIVKEQSIHDQLKGGAISIKRDGEEVKIKESQIQEELVKQSEKLLKIFEQLTNAADKTEDELNRLKKSAEETSQNIDILKDAQSASGGGRGFNVLGLAAGALNGIANVASIGLNAYFQTEVSQRMAYVQNAIGFASFANQQYDTYRKAAAGDIASQMLLPQYATSDYERELAKETNIYAAGKTAVSATRTVASGAQAVDGLMGPGLIGKVKSAASGSLDLGVTNVAQNAADTYVNYGDFARDITRNQIALQARQQNIDIHRQANYIPAEQMQVLRDYYVQLGSAVQGMGASFGTGDFINRVSTPEFLSQLNEYRISPERFAKLTEMGLRNIGSTFDIDKDVISLRKLEARKLGTAEENMQRMAILSSAGANNPQSNLETIIATGMAKGLNNSKAISMLIENTAGLAALTSGSKIGIDTTAAAVDSITSLMRADTPNKEQSLRTAVEDAVTFNELLKNNDFDFGNMVVQDRLQRNLKNIGVNVSDVSISTLSIMDKETLEGLYQKSNEDVSKYFLEQHGVIVDSSKSRNVLDTLRKSMFEKTVMGKGIVLAPHMLKVAEEAMSFDSFKDLPKEVTAKLAELGSILRIQGGAETIFNRLKNIEEIGRKQNKKLDAKEIIDKAVLDTDTLATGSEAQKSAAASAAAEKMGPDASGKLVQMQKSAEGADQVKAEKEFTSSAIESMKSFGDSIKDFKEAIAAQKQAANDMSRAASTLNQVAEIFKKSDKIFFVNSEDSKLTQKAGLGNR
jgi:hypothetical protein